MALSHNDYTWTTDGVGNPYIASTLSTLGAVQKKSAQTLDNYGNVTQTQLFDWASLSTPARTYNHTYLYNQNYSPKYILNRLSTSTVTPAGGSQVTLVTKTYDNSPSDVVGMQEHDPGYTTSYTLRGNLASSTSLGTVTGYGYDIGGNITSKSVNGLPACGQADDNSLWDELRLESAAGGLALVRASAGHIVMIPFDGKEKHLESEYRFPISAFGKAGKMVAWWFPRDLLDFRGDFMIESTKGETIARGRPSVLGFQPLALSETGRHIAFWGRWEGKMQKGLYWASFDFADHGFVAEGTGYPDWSPDGEALVYDKVGRLYVFDLPNSSSKLLVAGRDPTWSPNGKWIAFVAADGHASLMTANGVPVSWAVGAHQPIGGVNWSPDGRYVSFSEKLPPGFGLLDEIARLVVCRVSDGKAITVSRSVDYRPFQWIVDYRKFCGRCTLKVAP